MALQILCLVFTSIIIARFLENKKYIVASIAHAVLFVILSFLTIFSMEFKPVQEMCIRWIGEIYYNSLHSALIESSTYVFGNLSALLIIEFIIFVVLPILSVAVIIKKIRNQYKKIKVNKNLFGTHLPINYGINPNKDSSYSLNKTYLILGKLLN